MDYCTLMLPSFKELTVSKITSKIEKDEKEFKHLSIELKYKVSFKFQANSTKASFKIRARKSNKLFDSLPSSIIIYQTTFVRNK